MNDHIIAEGLLGTVTWVNRDLGYCRCPGISLHTHRNADRDCRLSLDGAPTIYCLHTSCGDAVADANRKLRSAIGKAERGVSGLRVNPWVPTVADIERGRLAARKHQLAQRSRDALTHILAKFRMELAEMNESSPMPLTGDPRDDWRLLLRLFPAEAVVWIGDTKDSCNEEADAARKSYCQTHFRPASAWLQEACAPGQFTCPSVFQAGVHSRSNANVAGRPFLVVESDVLVKEEMVAVFWWMRQFLRLRAVVDTGGKSLHGWFAFPAIGLLEELQCILPSFGCDKALFKASQPCRLPGAKRGEKMQTLLWLDLEDWQ